MDQIRTIKMKLGQVQQLNGGSFSLQLLVDRRTLGSPVSICCLSESWATNEALKPHVRTQFWRTLSHQPHVLCTRSSMDIIFSKRDILNGINWTPPPFLLLEQRLVE